MAEPGSEMSESCIICKCMGSFTSRLHTETLDPVSTSLISTSNNKIKDFKNELWSCTWDEIIIFGIWKLSNLIYIVGFTLQINSHRYNKQIAFGAI